MQNILLNGGEIRMKHTPTPWQMEKGELSSAWFIHNSGSEVCLVPKNTMYQEANARLIAAAPDLLAACEKAVKNLETKVNAHSYVEPTIDMIKEAIKKAKVS
jgi:hypothetical protein